MVLLIFGERVKHIQSFSKSAKESLLAPFLKLRQNSIQSSYKIIEFTKLSTSLTTCQVISITGKTVDFPYNNGFKLSLYTVLDYLLRFKMIVRLGRHFTVIIFPENLDVVLFGKSLTFAQLKFLSFC